MTTRWCEYDWCTINGHHDGARHWFNDGVGASHPSYAEYRNDEAVTVGAGISWWRHEDGAHAAVVIHIYGGNGLDADAHLCLDEAIELRGLLDHAIGVATSIRGAL